MILDNLDKKILQSLTTGTSSYQELARNCDVTRNTVYRRIASLESRGIIKNTLRCIVNFEKLDITTITVGAKVSQNEQRKALQMLAAHRNVRLLSRSYGSHNITLVIFCYKGKEGEVIQSVSSILEEVNATDVDISVGFSWEKMDLTTLDSQLETENNIDCIMENGQYQRPLNMKR
jgi:DNA-binding Lrp family transcriptional regulator